MPVAEVQAELLGRGGLSQVGQTLLDAQPGGTVSYYTFKQPQGPPREVVKVSGVWESPPRMPEQRAHFSLKRVSQDSGGCGQEGFI